MMATLITLMVPVFAAAMSRVNEIETICLPAFEEDEDEAVMETSFVF
ncbi:MAG: hypothetical protein II627_05530 [Lachnospiraceae bacterium]|nr:hypothetical protein [Lachnospiraceae bacterium]